MSDRTLKTMTLVLFCLILLGSHTALAAEVEAEAPSELGVLFAEIPGVAGSLDPSSELLSNPTRVITGAEGAIVRLDNGQVLRFDGNSAVDLEANADSEVWMRVLAGRVTAYGKARNNLLTAGAGSKVLLKPSYDDPMIAERALLGLDEATGRRETRSRSQRRQRSVELEVRDDR